MSCRCPRHIVSFVVPRLEPQRQLACLPIDHNGAESLYDRVGQRIKLCHLAFYLTAFLHAFSALNETCLRVDNHSVPQTKIDAESAVARFRFCRIQHCIHFPFALEIHLVRQLIGCCGGQRHERQCHQRPTHSHSLPPIRPPPPPWGAHATNLPGAPPLPPPPPHPPPAPAIILIPCRGRAREYEQLLRCRDPAIGALRLGAEALTRRLVGVLLLDRDDEVDAFG